jgi:hypothetical protein
MNEPEMSDMSDPVPADVRDAQLQRIPIRVFVTCRDTGVTANQRKTIFKYVLSDHVAWGIPIDLEYCKSVVNLVRLSLDRTLGDELYDEAYPLPRSGLLDF